MSCQDCGQDTLSDGICIECTNKRIDLYPRLSKILLRLDTEIKRREKLFNDLPIGTNLNELHKNNLMIIDMLKKIRDDIK